MSLILKGIDMPSKFPMQLTINPNGEIIRTDGDMIAYYGHAIQIPKGHGRLGDLGKLAKLISAFGESLKESVRGNRLLMTERDICYAIAVLTEHFQEYEPLLEAEGEE